MASDPETIQCHECDTEIDFDDAYYLDEVGDVCQDCYYQGSTECSLCSERFTDGHSSPFFALIAEACHATHGTIPTLPGVYISTDGDGLPDMSVPLIGSPTLYRRSFRWVCPLPIPESEIEISGMICTGCSSHYHLPQKFGPTLKCPELQVMKRALLRNPRLAQSLEIDDECKWAGENWRDHLTQLGLQRQRAQFRPWTPWTILQHRGVNLYAHLYQKHWSAAITDPRPCWRKETATARAKEMGIFITAPSLPGWFPEMGDYHSMYEMDKDRHLKIFRHAIDHGYVTQDGLAQDAPLCMDWFFIGRMARKSARAARFQTQFPQYHDAQVIARLTSESAALQHIIDCYRQRCQWAARKPLPIDRKALRDGWNSHRPKLARLIS